MRGFTDSLYLVPGNDRGGSADRYASCVPVLAAVFCSAIMLRQLLDFDRAVRWAEFIFSEWIRNSLNIEKIEKRGRPIRGGPESVGPGPGRPIGKPIKVFRDWARAVIWAEFIFSDWARKSPKIEKRGRPKARGTA